MACKVCLNKLTCGFGRELDATRKKAMSCNEKHIGMRDGGGLRWPSKIIVMLTGIIIKIFERFLECDDHMNDYFISCSSSRIALLTLKSMAHEMTLNSSIFNAWKGQCHLCRSYLMKYAINPLVTTYFNVSANNFTLVLNRRAVAKKLTLKMVKDLKKKERHANSLR